ncbi:hypothetical protein EYF80_066646 [Liparis tanakae]|uniref:Uncharacterized protein n=1 Tax=Liparis tanakae TaxID=230148 RepID=A0A4Z2E381_9TELE|nr:hypothetical protein EYF80_066646 [Liparis tanakae]
MTLVAGVMLGGWQRANPSQQTPTLLPRNPVQEEEEEEEERACWLDFVLVALGDDKVAVVVVVGMVG